MKYLQKGAEQASAAAYAVADKVPASVVGHGQEGGSAAGEQPGLNRQKSAEQLQNISAQLDTIFATIVATASCILCSMGGGGFIAGIVVGVLLLNEGSVCVVGFTIAIVAPIACCYAHRRMTTLHNTIHNVLDLAKTEGSIREKLKARADQLVKEQAGGVAESIADSIIGPLRDEINTQFMMVLLGPPAGLGLIGVVLIGCRSAVSDETGQVVMIIIGVLSIVGGLIGLCATYPIYSRIMKEVDAKLIDPWKASINEMVIGLMKEMGHAVVSKVVDMAEDMAKNHV
eukprot:gnl/MRDRNA2_/MRDRNA2_34034_c0_seq1.p1 gnl/MRDRNA2_/MRDRNA2_34034_c0~~gnl/MRDRNA2_/MRDRNA2_34034_c0_seq1.p1  ORF type:complete len:286 (+),score=54.09 gnl/MRDRNA2_/MRDRNA2_34034_c0_seq1:74-931(+)